MSTLWFDLEEIDDSDYEDSDNPNYDEDDDYEELYEKLADGEEDDIICKQCGAIVDDGYQCNICGWLVGILKWKS